MEKNERIRNQNGYYLKIFILIILVCTLWQPSLVKATCSSGIKGNGTSGIYININGAPYTTFATYSWGQYAYGKEGCAWFASARVKELTGKGSAIYSGWAWYNTQYSNYGFSIGSEPRAKSLACYGNHVAVVEAVNGDTITVSQGGMGGLSDAAHGYCVISTMSRAKLESQSGCGTFYGYVYMNSSNDPLSISNIQVSNVTSDSYTVSCNITGNATRALFPTWPSADDSGNPIWHEGTISGNTATCVIRRSDHGNKVGTYISHIYIYDASGNNVAAEAPAVQLVAFDSCLDYPTANASYTDTVYVAGWVVIPGGITNVTGWCNGISFDLPLFDRSDVPNGKGFNAFIPETYMKNGTNSLDIYGYHGTTPYHIKNINFTYKDIKRPTISDVKIINITEDSYTVTCKVSDNVKVTKVYFPTWPSIGSSADPVWHQGTINGDIASCVIKKSDHENKTGTYISHIYVYDDAGNEASYAAPAVELGKKHQHDYVSTIKKPATCTESGIRLYICKDNDDSYEEEIPATGHQHTKLRNVKEATCAEAGYTGDTYCKDCNTKLNSGETIEKKAHTWDEGKITKNATCTEKGIKTFTCTVCESTRIEEIPATGHGNTITKFAKEASCKSEGYTGDVYCQDCGKLIEEGKILPKTEHTWNAGEITQAATCTGEGIKTFTCISCGTIRTEVIPATGHQHTELRDVKEATCAEAGYTGDTYCKDCNTKLNSGEVIEKKSHIWNEGKITKNATCIEKGIKTYTCTVCNEIKTEEIPAMGHGNIITKFAKEASCKSEGYTGDVYCQDCGKLIEEGKILPKTEHTWNAGEITQAATCTGEGIKTFTCISCGTIRTEVIPATGHGITEIRNVKEATYTEEGYTGDTYCTVCGQKIGFGSTIAKLEQQKLTSGKIIKDKTTNGVYKVQGDGLSVEFTKPVSKKASVKIPDTIQVNGIVCKVTGIAANAFKNNTSLKTVTIGKNITVIGANAFYGCKNLSKIYGGSRIANIGYKAFFNCGNLSSITISGTVRSIGKLAFYNCKKLRTIVIKSTALSSRNVGTKAFTGTYTRPTVKVPAKQMNTYKKLLRSKGMSSKAIYKK